MKNEFLYPNSNALTVTADTRGMLVTELLVVDVCLDNQLGNTMMMEEDNSSSNGFEAAAMTLNDQEEHMVRYEHQQAPMTYNTAPSGTTLCFIGDARLQPSVDVCRRLPFAHYPPQQQHPTFMHHSPNNNIYRQPFYFYPSQQVTTQHQSVTNYSLLQIFQPYGGFYPPPLIRQRLLLQHHQHLFANAMPSSSSIIVEPNHRVLPTNNTDDDDDVVQVFTSTQPTAVLLCDGDENVQYLDENELTEEEEEMTSINTTEDVSSSSMIPPLHHIVFGDFDATADAGDHPTSTTDQIEQVRDKRY
jgi:hypothetical protein